MREEEVERIRRIVAAMQNVLDELDAAGLGIAAAHVQQALEIVRNGGAVEKDGADSPDGKAPAGGRSVTRH